MKYTIDYQYLPKGRERPSDDGDVVAETIDENGFALIPNVGDYVTIGSSEGKHEEFQGCVKTRYFYYMRAGDQIHCNINIVVQEVDEKDSIWGELIKM